MGMCGFFMTFYGTYSKMYRTCFVINLLDWTLGGEYWNDEKWAKLHLGSEFSGCLHWCLDAFHRWLISSSNSSRFLCCGTQPSRMVLKISRPLIKYLEEKTKTVRKFRMGQAAYEKLSKQRQPLLKNFTDEIKSWLIRQPTPRLGPAVSPQRCGRSITCVTVCVCTCTHTLWFQFNQCLPTAHRTHSAVSSGIRSSETVET